LDGLCKILSLDMRVVDPAWIGMKLRKLLNYPEPLGDFMAFTPGSRKQQNWPSTVSYVARLIIHRYAMLGILDEEGYPVQAMGVLEPPAPGAAPKMKDMKRSEEHTSELQSLRHLVCRLLLEKKHQMTSLPIITIDY